MSPISLVYPEVMEEGVGDYYRGEGLLFARDLGHEMESIIIVKVTTVPPELVEIS